MKYRSFLPLLIFEVGLFSCAPESGQLSEKIWINMDSLIRAQATGVTIEKTARLGDDQSTGTTSVQENWSGELEAFARLSVMNKPVYRNQYLETTGPDPTSNLFLKKIIATDSTAPVRELRLSVHPDTWRIIRLEGSLRESSLLYSKQEELTLEFDPHTGRLERYAVSGKQKMAWFKPDAYEVKASVIYR